MSTNPMRASLIETVSQRKGEMQECAPTGSRQDAAPLYGAVAWLIGYHGEFLTDTRGTGVINRMFHGYAPYKGTIEGRRNGVLVSTNDGEAVRLCALVSGRARKAFHHPGTRVYEGMIVGENSRDNDLDVNPMRAKQLNNIRTHSRTRRSASRRVMR